MSPRNSDFPGCRGFLQSRRQFLNSALSGLTVGFPLASAIARAGTASPPPGRKPIKSCIFVFYYGGPSHIDTYDPKPAAPAEVRGQFKNIATSVPGLHISELLPRMSQLMHKVVLVRSMTHRMTNHDAASHEAFAGREPLIGDRENFSAVNENDEFPGLGARISFARRHETLPLAAATLPYYIYNVIRVPGQAGGFLGPAFDPFLIQCDPEKQTYQADQLGLQNGITGDRVGHRRELLSSLNVGWNGSASAARLKGYYDKAFELLRSESIRVAIDIEREPRAVRERYGLYPFPRDLEDIPLPATPRHGLAQNMRGQNLLVARRLVEAGVPFVSVNDYRRNGPNWDTHKNNFEWLQKWLVQPADDALSALIEDLDQRGLLETTLVVAVGEFGRSPRVNKDLGRDHWPFCYTALLAGGGVSGGTIYGKSDNIGAWPTQNPVTPGDLSATILWRFGIDPESPMHDMLGRPFKLAEGNPVSSIFG